MCHAYPGDRVVMTSGTSPTAFGSVTGFRTLQTVHGIFGDAHARPLRLVRRGKKQSVGPCIGAL
jgi:hypothetical protein